MFFGKKTVVLEKLSYLYWHDVTGERVRIPMREDRKNANAIKRSVTLLGEIKDFNISL